MYGCVGTVTPRDVSLIFAFEKRVDAKFIRQIVPKEHYDIMQISDCKFVMPITSNKDPCTLIETVDIHDFTRQITTRSPNLKLFVAKDLRLFDNDYVCLDGYIFGMHSDYIVDVRSQIMQMEQDLLL